MIRTAILLALLLTVEEFDGKVVGVTDGDTIKVQRDGEEVMVTLNGIDCPEKRQAFGKKTKQPASDLAFGKEVKVRVQWTDRHDRPVSDVILPDGKSLNEELVRLGLAWWYKKNSTDKTLERLEAEARKGKRGLWAGTSPTPPWEWAVQQRAIDAADSAVVKPNGIEIVALLPDPADHEQKIRVANSTDSALNLDGWKVWNRAGRKFLLAGEVPAGGNLEITLIDSDFSLNNDGDTVALVDFLFLRSRVSYTEDEVVQGEWVEVGGD